MRTITTPESDTASGGKALRRALGLLVVVAASVNACFAAGPIQNLRPMGWAHTKLAKDVDARHPNTLVDVIVQFRQTPGAKHYLRMAARGATVKAKLPGIRATAVRLPASAIAQLEQDPDVFYVTPDRPVQLTRTGLINI